jgi:hypothetical protein
LLAQLRPDFRGAVFSFEFCAAELSLEKFRNALNFFVVSFGDGYAGRGKNRRQKEEIENQSC